MTEFVICPHQPQANFCILRMTHILTAGMTFQTTNTTLCFYGHMYPQDVLCSLGSGWEDHWDSEREECPGEWGSLGSELGCKQKRSGRDLKTNWGEMLTEPPCHITFTMCQRRLLLVPLLATSLLITLLYKVVSHWVTLWGLLADSLHLAVSPRAPPSLLHSFSRFPGPCKLPWKLEWVWTPWATWTRKADWTPLLSLGPLSNVN